LNEEERDALVAAIRAADEANSETGLPRREQVVRRERWLSLLAEFADRLPRMRLSICPFTGKPLKRAFDPFALDGPFWMARCPCQFDEPDPPPTFRVLLGAIDLRGREPVEVEDDVQPGPAVPLVVPELLALPGMRAVVSRLEMETGDVAYPIAYFSDQPTDPADLHQPWGRLDFWFKKEEGGDASWFASNAPWDFELDPYLDSGQLGYIHPDQPDRVWHRGEPGAPPYPFDGLTGDRAPQAIAGGQRWLLDLPDGEPFDPFDE
jgi:hypothetical protein